MNCTATSPELSINPAINQNWYFKKKVLPLSHMKEAFPINKGLAKEKEKYKIYLYNL